MKWKWTVQRYVLREVMQTWLAVTGVLVAILVSNQLSRVLGRAASDDFGRHVVFTLIALGAIMNLSVIVPVGLLLAIVLALGRLYHDSEMTALQGCGFAPSRMLAPLFCFAIVIAAGLAWLSFVQVPRADQQAQLLRQSAVKEAQFGQLDAGRFRSFMSAGGDAVFYAERVDEEGVLHNVFVRREAQDRIEVALADTATYSKAASNGMHFVTLFNGRRYEGVPGHSEFRVIEFREHGIPIVTPEDTIGTANDPDTKPTGDLLGSTAPSDIAQLQFRASSPIMALVLTLLAVPLSKLRPRQGRYARVGFAIVVYFVYSNLLSAAKVWVEKGQLPPSIGVWWVHVLLLAFGAYLLYRDSRSA
jgi:lipopolysaccharide export system permease protein